MKLLAIVLLAMLMVVLWKLGNDQRTRRGWRGMDAQEAIMQSESGSGVVVFNDTATLGDWWFMPKEHWPMDTEAMPESGVCWLESKDDSLTELLPQFGFALVICDRQTQSTLESLLGGCEVDDDDFG